MIALDGLAAATQHEQDRTLDLENVGSQRNFCIPATRVTSDHCHHKSVNFTQTPGVWVGFFFLTPSLTLILVGKTQLLTGKTPFKAEFQAEASADKDK